MSKISDNETFSLMLTLTEKEIEMYAREAIERKVENKIEVIKYAHRLGCDMNKLLIEAVLQNDIFCVGLCLKLGAKISATLTDSEMTLLHLCALKGHNALLKSFIKQGIDINKKSEFGSPPLQLALAYDNHDCAKELINANADLVWVDFDTDDTTDTTDSDVSFDTDSDVESGSDNELDREYDDPCPCCGTTYREYKEGKKRKKEEKEKLKEEKKLLPPKINYISALDIILRDYDVRQKSLLDLVVAKLPKLDNKITREVKSLIIKKFFEEVDVILSKFPEILNDKCDQDTTILSFLIDSERKDLGAKFIRSDIVDFDVKIKVPYIHSFARENDIDSLSYVLSRDPKQISKLSHDKKTCVDFVISEFLKNVEKEEQIIYTIKFLIDKGCNINELTFYAAIQYSNAKIVQLLVESGFKIKVKCKNVKQFFPAISNSDYLGFAAQLGKNDIVELLLNNGATINFYNALPNCLLLAIKFNNDKTVDFLMSKTEIKKYCVSDFIKKRLLDFAINSGVTNKKILQHFTTNDIIDILITDSEQIKINSFEKNIESHIEDYEENRNVVLKSFQKILIFLKACAMNKTINEMGDVINKYFKAYSYQFFDNLKTDVLNIFIQSPMDECFDIVIALNECDYEMRKTLFEKFIEIKEHSLKHEMHNINSLIKMTEKCLEKKHESKKFTIHYANNDDASYIEKVLVKLKYPTEMSHYKEMCDKIKDKHCIITESSSAISVQDKVSNVTACVFKIKTLRTPNTWFDFYSYNIGLNDKCDHNHMFPFVLDRKLKEIPHFEKCVSDNVNKFGILKLKYFYGTLTTAKTTTFGFFEYFVDATGTLFHRLFHPYNEVSEKTRKLVMKHFPEELKRTHNIKI